MIWLQLHLHRAAGLPSCWSYLRLLLDCVHNHLVIAGLELCRIRGGFVKLQGWDGRGGPAAVRRLAE
jgi:hypothetical protein